VEVGDQGSIYVHVEEDALMKTSTTVAPGNADLVIVNGNVITMDERDTRGEALACKFGRLAAVGTNHEILRLAGQGTRVLDVDRRCVLPGFIDTHMHVVGAGFSLDEVNCRTPPNDSIVSVLERIRERAAVTPPGDWIICGGYNLGLVWEAEGRHINRSDIDKAAPEHPVQINSVGGHTGSIYNSLALKLAGIAAATPDPDPPAVIERDPVTREPTGRVSEAAEAPLRALIPRPTQQDVERAILRAADQFVAWGLTTVTDASTHPGALRAYQRLVREGRLPVRLGVLIHRSTGSSDDGDAPGDDRLRIQGIKIFADGAFTGRTAAMYDPYEGEAVPPSSPQYRGLLHVAPEEIHDAIRRAHLAGLRPCIHAQGDRGIDIVLDGIEAALAERPARDHRIRIEHCGLTLCLVVHQLPGWRCQHQLGLLGRGEDAVDLRSAVISGIRHSGRRQRRLSGHYR